MTCLIVPTYILREIDSKLDEQIALNPDAAADRDLFRNQLIEYVNENGVVPDFSLAKQDDQS